VRVASCIRGTRRFAAAFDDGELHVLDGVAPLSRGTDFGALRTASRTGECFALDEVELLPVVSDPGKIICLGLNYRGHVEETERDLPTYPVLFTKFGSSLVGAREAIVLPPESSQVDYEAELAVVIGTEARRAPTSAALDCVAGYAVANDVTMRDYQYKSHQWLQGKAWPRSTPLGPWLTTSDEVGDAGDLGISLTLNGSEMQASNTRRMIFDVATTIAMLSEFTRLDPGDVVLMGTPGGVGYRRDPQVFLRPGDRVRVEIDRLGSLENLVVAEAIDTPAGDRV
jgi:acylpyruvate hydrolase